VTEYRSRMRPLPYLTAELPGTGGLVRQSPEDFRVEEIPAYEPEDRGDHLFVEIEKREITTFDAVQALARAVGVSPRDLGYAGLKDRHAVTRQTVSLPPPVAPEALEGLELPGLTVLRVRRHPHKLRTGHLRGNRFVLRLRQVEGGAEAAAGRARAVLGQLARPPGSPNWFGAQRFGAAGDNAAAGRALVRGERPPGGPVRGRKKRLLISAYQSSMFNEVLRQRIDDRLFDRVLAGDILQKRASGGLFASDQPAVDQARLEAGEVVPTGPMFGHRMKSPPEGSEARAREDVVLAVEELALADFARAGKLAQGTRRPLAVDLGETVVAVVDSEAIELRFELPAGAYATAVLREVIKGPDEFPG
jgi:tRNA pseudouridine13 synthase